MTDGRNIKVVKGILRLLLLVCGSNSMKLSIERGRAAIVVESVKNEARCIVFIGGNRSISLYDYEIMEMLAMFDIM